jgi:hypothetical protein
MFKRGWSFPTTFPLPFHWKTRVWSNLWNPEFWVEFRPIQNTPNSLGTHFRFSMTHMLSCQNKTRNWFRAFWTICDSKPIPGSTKMAQQLVFQWTFVYLLSSESPTYLLTRNIRIFSSSPPLLSTSKALRYPIPHPKSNRFEELKVGIWISVPTKPNCDPPWVHQVDCYSWIFLGNPRRARFPRNFWVVDLLWESSWGFGSQLKGLAQVIELFLCGRISKRKRRAFVASTGPSR